MNFFIRVAVGLMFFGGGPIAAQEPVQDRVPADSTFTLDRSSHDFGTLARGEAGRTVFTVTNTDTVPLVLLDVRIPCRCTRVDWPRRPIPPGGRAELAVTYKERQPGTFYKVIEVVTNGDPQRISFRIQGSVAAH